MILDELKERIHKRCNSNFHFDTLDWNVRVWIAEMCNIIDEKLTEKEDTSAAKNEKRWEEAEK